MRELTPLDKVSAIDAATRTKLADFWITSVEEFVSTARASNQQHQSGRKALALALGLSEARLNELLEAAMPHLPADVSFSVPVELDVGDGLFLDNFSDLDEAAFSPPVNLPPKVEPLAPLPAPQFQGVRNSCVAFTLAAIYQALSKDPTDLSEQFLYWACKDRDKIPGDVGTDPLVGMRVLQEVGICTEATWPYRPTPRDDANPGHERPPEPAFVEAQTRRIKAFQQLPGKDFRQIKAALAAGKPVLIGLPIWEHWQGAWQGQSLGKLRSPLPGERRRGGHAMCVLGYRDDPAAPGGGYFIVRNSWGPEWARDNPDGPGYCHVPYKLVFEQGLAAIAAEGVAVAPPAPARGAARGKAGRRRLGGSGEDGEVSLEEVYAELQELREEFAEGLRAVQARLDALAARLPGGVPVVEPAEAPAPSTAPEAIAADERAPSPGAPTRAPDTVFSGPLVLRRGTEGQAAELLTPLGISPEGKPLLTIDAAAAAEQARGRLGGESKERQQLYRAKENSRAGHLGVVADIEQNDLAQARWAVVVNAFEDSALIKAVWPLIEHRMRQMGHTPPAVTFRDGESAGAWHARQSGDKNLRQHWGQVAPVLIYRHGETAGAWLARHQVSQGPVDPRRGVPFYLMLLGRPGPLNPADEAYIPLTFQYELDIFWGVGRVCFTDEQGHHRLADYTTYAERLAGFEQRQDAASRLRKEVVYFSTRHQLDTSTIRSTQELVVPLTEWHANPENIPSKRGFGKRAFIADDATRSQLEAVLGGSGEGKPPAVLFTASHGLGLPLSDARLALHQGALVTQDWSGEGPVLREHWLAGEDLGASTQVEGMMAFLFACYGAGCPDEDEFIFDEERGRPRIAHFPLIAQLPQRLLVSGALAVLGHVERAWTYSFSGTDGARAQTQGFEDVLGRLLRGERAGSATDDFNVIQGSRAMALTQELENIRFNKQVEPLDLARLWMARNDARNYALLGDPAARLPY